MQCRFLLANPTKTIVFAQSKKVDHTCGHGLNRNKPKTVSVSLVAHMLSVINVSSSEDKLGFNGHFGSMFTWQ